MAFGFADFVSIIVAIKNTYFLVAVFTNIWMLMLDKCDDWCLWEMWSHKNLSTNVGAGHLEGRFHYGHVTLLACPNKLQSALKRNVNEVYLEGTMKICFSRSVKV